MGYTTRKQNARDHPRNRAVTVSACTPAHPAPPLPLAHAPCYTDENTAKMAL
eukprot:COSAG02_NODE_26539_length_630_cov_7.975518_1_plen_51_part_01